MKLARSKPPRTQRAFATPWGELDYLCGKIRYWLYARKEHSKAECYMNRLEKVLNALPDSELAIIQEEGLALLCELQGDLDAAIAHREREILLTQRLHHEAQSPRYDASTRAYMLRDRGIRELKERLAIVGSLRKDLARSQEQKQTIKVQAPKSTRVAI